MDAGAMARLWKIYEEKICCLFGSIGSHFFPSCFRSCFLTKVFRHILLGSANCEILYKSRIVYYFLLRFGNFSRQHWSSHIHCPCKFGENLIASSPPLLVQFANHSRRGHGNPALGCRVDFQLVLIICRGMLTIPPTPPPANYCTHLTTDASHSVQRFIFARPTANPSLSFMWVSRFSFPQFLFSCFFPVLVSRTKMRDKYQFCVLRFAKVEFLFRLI